jgi:hypothetical protein
MATIRAVANGNWSSTSTWNGGALPGNGDTVYANGWNVTIDQNVNIGGTNNPTVNAGAFVSGQWYEITFVGTTSFPGATSNTVGTIFLATGAGTGTGTAKAIATITTALNAAAGAASGGQFNISATYNITCDIRAGTTTCLNVTGSAALSLNGLRISGGTSANAHGINNAGTSPIAISGGSILGPTGANSSVLNSSSATITISAGTTIAGGGNSGIGITNSAGGIISISGTIISGSFQPTPGFSISNLLGGGVIISSSIITGGDRIAAISNATSGYVTLTGCTLNGAGNVGAGGAAVINSGVGTITASACDFTSNTFSNAISGTNINANVSLSGNFYDHWQGIPAVAVAKWKLGTSPTLGQHRFALAGTTDSYFTMYGSDNGAFGNPIAANVRSGVVYGGGNLTGSCAVPAAGSVALGVPVDATTGTAILTQANVQSALTEQGITTARAGNLDNLDTTVSSRLSPSGTLATVTTLTNAPTVPTAAEIATAVEGSLLNEGDGQAVLNAIVGAIGNTNLSEVSLVAAVRADLERTGGKMDSIPTTAAPTAAQNATAVWGAATRSVTGGTVDTLTNAPASVTPSDIWSYNARTLTSASGPTAVQIRQEMDSNSTQLSAIKAKTDNLPADPADQSLLEAAIAGVTAPTAGQVASQVRTELSSELAKVAALNTERLANVATTAIVGNLIAQANS